MNPLNMSSIMPKRRLEKFINDMTTGLINENKFLKISILDRAAARTARIICL
jgi:hypothetical protein